MRNISILILLLCFPIQSCTICYFSLQNMIDSKTIKSENIENKKENSSFKYSIKIDGIKYFRTMTSAYTKEEMNKFENEYSKATSEVLSKKHINPIFVSPETKSDLSINIMVTPFVGAVSEEYLTGLSFGLIPTWPTREKQYIFEFENTVTGQRHKYWIDDKRFNHLIAFPFFWINFLMDSPLDKYEEALGNFIDNYKILTRP